ncbi:alpha/beta hydrolase [Lactiplantibacillus plantarum]|uniref:alpha/beta hydrolase n=1 Tax=Lactiplantibacillus plantarum TaxID=1590 RepID=UPI002877555D|nr:alpha/beta hydrolase [Lactiplantibacillus plantarum]WND29772.1 alpha/beta hydrolase [Lactiplantibacillus plantarum]
MVTPLKTLMGFSVHLNVQLKFYNLPNIKKQAIWLKYALKYISQQYEFRKISLIGHSNGGLIITYALEHNLTSHYLTVQKVMTIAAPYNLNDSSVRSETELLENLIANRKYIPNSIDMYSLAGTQSYSNDGLVPLYSVLAGRYIYQKQVKHYTQITVSGVGAEHSDLPQNQQIIMAIEQYIEK